MYYYTFYYYVQLSKGDANNISLNRQTAYRCIIVPTYMNIMKQFIKNHPYTINSLYYYSVPIFI